jgi:signal transduction histidine kinase
VSALLTGAILIITYVITSGVVHSDFMDRLSQQSRLEVVHYATPDVREVMDTSAYLLMNPDVSIYDSAGKLLHRHGDFKIPATWVNFMRKNETFNADRDEYYSVARKFAYRNKAYIVFVSARDLPAEHELEILVRSMATGWLVSLVLSYLAGLYFSSNALSPVKHVVNDVNKISEENLGYRLKVQKDNSKFDEIDELIHTFNELLNRIESAFISQKRFVQHASHELKTPLTSILAEAELALTKERNAADYQRTLAVIVAETERLVSTTHGLLTLARLEEGRLTSELAFVDVLEVCETAVAAVPLHHPGREIDFKKRPISLYVYGNRQLIEMALMNILDNALKYSTGKVLVDVKKAGDDVVIKVEDNGMGIPATDLERIKDPLVRGSNVTALPGAGLGLSLVDRIVTALKGSFEILSEEGKGTICILMLPVHALPPQNIKTH